EVAGLHFQAVVAAQVAEGFARDKAAGSRWRLLPMQGNLFLDPAALGGEQLVDSLSGSAGRYHHGHRAVFHPDVGGFAAAGADDLGNEVMALPVFRLWLPCRHWCAALT